MSKENKDFDEKGDCPIYNENSTRDYFNNIEDMMNEKYGEGNWDWNDVDSSSWVW